MHLYSEKEVLFEADLKSAVDLVVEEDWTIERAAMECNVNADTLEEKLLDEFGYR